MTGSTRQRIASGGFDQAVLDELRTLTRPVVLGRLTPTGDNDWSDEDLDDLVQDTIVRVGIDRVVLAAEEAGRDDAFRRWLRKAMRTTLDVRARRSPSGRLLRAIDDALREDPQQFHLENRCWRLVSDARTDIWHGRRMELVQAAWTVDTTNVRMSRTAAKTPALGARRDIRAVCAAVMAVSGPIEKSDLIEVIADRFNATHEAYFDYRDLSTLSHDPPDPSADTEPDEDPEAACCGSQWHEALSTGTEGCTRLAK